MNKPINKFLCALLLITVGSQIKAQINAQLLGRYSIGTYNADGGVAEISAYDPSSKRMFVTNGPDNSLRIVNLTNPASPVQISSISMAPYGSDITSVACNKKGIIAAAILDSNGKTNASSIVFFDINGNFISKVKVGANADNVVFTPNGNKVLVANEGEPNNGYTIDPEGSVSIIDVSGGFAGLTQSNVQTAGFTAFNAPTVIDSKIKITGKIQASGVFSRNSTVAEDLEPEYITVSDDNTTAWVTCQENNAIAVVNINTATVTSLLPLGFKNHNLTGNGLDPSDRSLNNTTAQAAIANWPVFGMYQPDAISSYKVGTQTFLVTANEGDARADWGTANNEEVRAGHASYVLDTIKFGGVSNVTALKANGGLGRLNVTNRFGDFDNDGKFDSIFTYGARSFSIWNGSTGALVWDSKDDFEQRTLAMFPSNFNAGHNTNSLDDRSDNKGPEPESVTVGKILDSTYAFVGLERIGGIMIYNITNPNSPYFVQYINTRNFSQTPGLNSGGDLGPEGIIFVPRNESPNGKDLILLSNEVSGTVAVFQVNSRSAFQMQVLHASDMESGIDAPIDAPNFAAVLDTLEGTYPNTVKLASGDCYIPSPFLSAGEDASMQTPLRNTVSSYYSGTSAVRPAIGRTDIAMMNIMGFQGSAFGNHEFDLGTPEVNSIIGVDIRSNGADKRWIGAQFPYLSANLNFANDINLSYLTTTQRLSVDSFKTSPTITANSQKKGIAPSAIIEMNGEKVGLVGATTQVLAAISSPGATTVLSGGSDNMPALAAVLQPVIDSLRASGINKIIVMSHLQQLANEKALAPLLKGVDIIIAGGSHSLCADGNDRIRVGTTKVDKYPILTVNNDNEPVAILNTTAEWKYVGRFVCDFDSNGVLITNLLDSNINGAYAADTAMVTALYGTYAAGFTTGSKGANVRTLTTAIATVINNKDGNKFGKASVFLEGRRNFVRTEETNFGNLSSDANLWYARQYDNQVKVSIKNGGGIRSAIGNVNAVGTTTLLEKTLANPSASKLSGDISQLDIENSLRFNNGLVIGRVNTAGLKRILEHGISATKPGATPGQFPQVGGVAFSYDTTKVAGSKIQSLVIIDSLGNIQDTLVRNGLLHGDTTRTIKFVTLDFLYTGGDSYPFLANSNLRVNLDTAIKTTGVATFTTTGKEQDAFAEYMAASYTSNPYSLRDTSIFGDKRIQLLNARIDRIFNMGAGISSSQTPYLTTNRSDVSFTSILTVGDGVGTYKMAGIPDGLGAFDNNNGTFTLLMNHEINSTLGVARAHGGKGAFVSKWVINKSDLSVVSGSDLMRTAKLWNKATNSYVSYNSDTIINRFSRFCSADLPPVSSFLNGTTGTAERIFLNGEENGTEGRAMAHIATGPNAGTSYELPYLGKYSWENAVASPTKGAKTIVAGMDDGTGGQVYFYIGTKTKTGTEIDRAGLNNGKVFGVKVTGVKTESNTSIPAANSPFTLHDLGIVRDSTGASLESRSQTDSVTTFFRPEDGAWDPRKPTDFYFLTTNSFANPSRLWKLAFKSIANPEQGGTITAVLDGTEGAKMMDNMAIDSFGNIFIQEDVGNNAHIGKTWVYNIENDRLVEIAQHDTSRFLTGASRFLTQDEEASGIIDMKNILGKGKFLLVDQAHYSTDTELVEGGQLLAMTVTDLSLSNVAIVQDSIEIGVIDSNSLVNVTASLVPNADTYKWTVPTGVVIVSGQGTRNLVVRFTNPVKFASPVTKPANILCQAMILLSGVKSNVDTVKITKTKPAFAINSIIGNANRSLTKGAWTSTTTAGSTGNIVNVVSTAGLKAGYLVKLTAGTGNIGSNNVVDSVISATQFRLKNNMTVDASASATLKTFIVPQNTFTAYTSAAGATNLLTLVTVTSTTGLAEGMLLSKTAGTGTLKAGTVVSKIIDATRFVISLAPTVDLSNSAVLVGTPVLTNICPIAVSNGLSSEVDYSVIATPVNNIGYKFSVTKGARISRIGDSTIVGYDTATTTALLTVNTRANSIGVVFDSSFVSGTVSAQPYNNAGTALAFKVSVKNIKAAIYKVTSTAPAIKNTIVRYKANVTNGSDVTSYKWTLPLNSTALSGSILGQVVTTTTDTLSIRFDSTGRTTFFTAGSLKVEPINNCGTGTAKSFVLNGTTTLTKFEQGFELEEVIENSELTTATKVNVYPNPNQGNFTVSITSNEKVAPAYITIINMMGQV
ncbi:MAG: choice-of-anchor I family protein, partial [Bacteroidota bacterium]